MTIDSSGDLLDGGETDWEKPREEAGCSVLRRSFLSSLSSFVEDVPCLIGYLETRVELPEG